MFEGRDATKVLADHMLPRLGLRDFFDLLNIAQILLQY